MADFMGLVQQETPEQAVLRSWDPPEPIAKNAKTRLPASPGRKPDALWAMVDAVATSYQVPRDLPFLLVLAILATSVGGRRRLRVASDWIEVLALYIAVALASGERKSPVLATVAAPLLAVEKQMQRDKAAEMAVQRALRELRGAAADKIKRSGKTDPTSIANLESAVRELEETHVPAVPRLLADDSTPEAMALLMAQQGGRLGVLSSEAGLFAILAGRYSNAVPNLDLVLKAWSGDQCRVDRIGRDPVILDEPVLSIGLAVQPDLLAGLAAARHFRGAGLLARYLYALPESMVGTRDCEDPLPVPNQVKRDYSMAIETLAKTMLESDVTSEINLSDGSRKALNVFRGELEPRLHPQRGDLAHIADWANKLPGQLVRIAALFTLFSNPKAVEVVEPDMWQALDLGPYFIGHALDAFELMSGRRSPLEPARAVLTWIQRKGLTTFTVRQAKRDLGGQAWVTGTGDVREAIADLEELCWVRQQPPPEEPRRQGRPSERYDVNPAAHDTSSGNFGDAPGEVLQECPSSLGTNPATAAAVHLLETKLGTVVLKT